jgi:hypothetical protein
MTKDEQIAELQALPYPLPKPTPSPIHIRTHNSSHGSTQLARPPLQLNHKHTRQCLEMHSAPPCPASAFP